MPSTDSTPLVTVGVPVFNGERFLEHTLRALQEQSLENIEILVGDNASTDSSLAIAERFAKEDRRFRVLTSDVTREPTWNFNRLLAEARAPLFMWNAADDVTRPDYLRDCRQALLDAPEAALCFSRVYGIDESGQPTSPFDDANIDVSMASPSRRVAVFFKRGAWYAVSAGVHRTELLRAAGGYGPFFGPDMVLGVHMAMRAPWIQLQDAFYLLRSHDDQMSKLLGADPVKQTRVFNPSHKRRVAFPQWYLTYRIFVEALIAPNPLRERLGASWEILRYWTIPNWRMLLFDLKRNAIRLRRGTYVGPYHRDEGA